LLEVGSALAALLAVRFVGNRLERDQLGQLVKQLI